MIKKNIALAPFSTFKIGNRAEYFCSVENIEELVGAIKWAQEKKISYKVFAGGSNIVFPDKKFKGLLIRIKNGTIRVNNRLMISGAGAPLAEVIKKSISLGLAGLETLSGIPGTVGGAIVGNAGAYGHSISEAVARVEILDEKLKRGWLPKNRCEFGYRESIFKRKPYIIIGAALKFKESDKKTLRKISREIIKIRLKKYRPGLKCPGSFFKNVLVHDVSEASLKLIPKSKIIEGKIPTGYLLEQVGAKGMRVGGIEIAKFHGNLFVNRGRAKAADVKRLAGILKSRVYKKFGIKLEEEVRYF